MRRAFLLAIAATLSVVLVITACKREAPPTTPPTAAPEAAEELVIPPLDLTAELALPDIEELGELDFGILLAGSEEEGAEVPTLEVPEIDTTLDLGDLLESSVP